MNMIPRSKKAKFRGFTLIEILIALIIFVIIASMTTASLHSIIQQHEILEQHSIALRDKSYAVAQLQQDAKKIIAQAVFQNDGKLLPAFEVMPKSLSFTILSKSLNPSLLRIHYFLDKNSFIREVFAINNKQIDRLLDRTALFKDVESIEWGYLSYGQGFTSNWPPGALTLNASGARILIPRAIKINMNLLHQGNLNLLLVIPTSNLPLQKT
jgi:general secretion pathway protein J